MVDINPLVSSSAVQGAYRKSKELIVDASQKPESQHQSFSEVLRAASNEALTKMRETDAVLEAGLEGKVETQQIVEATMALETSVTVAVSVRDKFVAAYQEILRMPI